MAGAYWILVADCWILGICTFKCPSSHTHRMAAQTIREKDPDATAYLLDYASFYDKDDVCKGALTMEIADKADAAAKVFVIICNRDEKTVCDPIRRGDVKSLFEYDQMKRNGNGIIPARTKVRWISTQK